ncbi:hypothetical protein ACP26L_29300 [Paenibacillus sp. S-38]|uniref:hypothetical protein n=1 Tax=Paenibacillus sp. S-38 TaxID=3416710 RepID=UPI003CF058E0
MNRWEFEQEIKLDMLHSLARSQRALARMLEAVAEVGVSTEAAARHLADNLQAISAYQRAMTVKITGLTVGRRRRRGVPGRPWLSRRVTAAGPAVRRRARAGAAGSKAPGEWKPEEGRFRA